MSEYGYQYASNNHDGAMIIKITEGEQPARYKMEVSVNGRCVCAASGTAQTMLDTFEDCMQKVVEQGGDDK